jgi:hypothetical protein
MKISDRNRTSFNKIQFALSLNLLILTSCVVDLPHRVYPSTWPVIKSVEENACPNIEGSYMDTGESNYKQQSYSFNRIIFSSRQNDIIATRVDISQVNGKTVDISVWSNDELIHRKVYSLDKEKFKCSEKNGLELSLGFGVGAYGYAWIFGTKYAYLNKGIDNSLIVRTAASGYEWVPTENPGNMWYRFSSIKK